MNKEKLVTDMMNCLDTHHQEYREPQIHSYIDNWAANKAGLIDILRKHPNWNEDAMAILFDYDTERIIDIDKFNVAFEDLFTIYLSTLKGKTTKFRTYESMEEEFHARDNPKRVVLDCGCFPWKRRSLCGTEFLIKSVDGCDGEVYYDDSNIHWKDAMDIRMFEEWETYKTFIFLKVFSKTTFADAYFVERYAQYGRKCNVGQKMSRILSKFFVSIGLNKCANYEHNFAILADAINPVKITRHTLLSVHPCDYLNMSYGGNEGDNSWKSCHNIDDGCYMAGTLSYLLDSTSMIFYTVNHEYDGDCFWKQPKINRQVYAYNQYVLLQSRLYPDHSDELNIKNFRAVVQQIFAVALGENNLWDLKTSEHIPNYVITANGAKHYHDYESYEYNPTISLLKGHEYSKIVIGANPPCLKCGKLYDGTNALHCNWCDYKTCAHCGSLHKENEMHVIEGQYYCDDYVYYCEDCETYHFEPIHIAYDATGDKRRVCNDCLKNYVRCAICGNYMAIELTSAYGDMDARICNLCDARIGRTEIYNERTA